jgi:uncharacterized protein
MTPKSLLFLVGLIVSGSTAFAADIPDYPFVFVTGSADVDTPPNIALCSLMIRGVDLDPGKAESTVGRRLTSALAHLTAKGVAASDIESSNIGKQILTTEYNSKEPAAVRGYDVSRGLQFKVRQLSSLPGIENEFVGSPNVDMINCQYDRTDRSALEADLLTKAIHSARDQADRLAEPLGRHITAAAAVSKMPFALVSSMLGMDNRFAELTDRMFKKSVSQDDLLVPSAIHLSVSVNVLFKMD